MNRDLRRFILRATLFFVPQAILLALVIAKFYAAGNPDHYLVSSRDKRARLHQTSPPRLILLGGSNIVFGFDSSLFEERLRLTPVNAGLSAWLGYRRAFGDAKTTVRSGDTVVLCIEYETFCMETRGPEVWELLRCDPASLFTFSPNEARWVIDNAFDFLGITARHSVPFLPGGTISNPDLAIPYRRHCFNLFGDVGPEWRTVQQKKHFEYDLPYATLAPMDERLADEVIATMNVYIRRFSERGAKVYLTYPPVTETAWGKNKGVIKAIDAKIRASLEAEVLTRPEETVYPNTCFFDTRYHLLADPSRTRTLLVAERLAARDMSRQR